MKRVFLFVLTNIAIMVVLSIILSLIGFNGYMDQQGVNLDLNALLVFSAVFGMGGSFISLLMSKWTAKKLTGARVIQTPQNQIEGWLSETVRRQANVAGIGMPEVAIYPGQEINAFATGANKNKALVAVSEGLLNKMSQDEVEAVLAHEVSHIANGDMVTLTLIQGVLNTFVFFLSRVIGFVIDRAVFKTQRGFGPAYFIIMIFAQIMLGILASIIVMWFSRQREYKADKGGAKLAGREKMIAALEQLRRQHEGPELPSQLAAFGISGKKGLSRLFMSHPPLTERISALKSAV